MMEFFQNETDTAPCSFAHSFLEGHLLRRCPKYQFESVFLLSDDQEYSISMGPLIACVRLEEQIPMFLVIINKNNIRQHVVRRIYSRLLTQVFGN